MSNGALLHSATEQMKNTKKHKGWYHTFQFMPCCCATISFKLKLPDIKTTVITETPIANSYEIICDDARIAENSEKLAMIEAEKSGQYKARKAYFAGFKGETKKETEKKLADGIYLFADLN
jgi:hypothetical protein